MTIAERLKREGFKHGKAEGRVEGKAEGRAEGEALVLKRLMQLKFGPIPENYQDKIQQADADTLLLWSERVLTAATMQDIFVN